MTQEELEQSVKRLRSNLYVQEVYFVDFEDGSSGIEVVEKWTGKRLHLRNPLNITLSQFEEGFLKMVTVPGTLH